MAEGSPYQPERAVPETVDDIRYWLQTELDKLSDAIELVHGEAVTSEMDYITAVQNGDISGASIMRGLGERTAIGTGTQEDMWPDATTDIIPTPADAGEQLSLESSSFEDGAGGNTGALTITVCYIDASGNEQTTTKDLSGKTAVDLTPSDVRFVQDIYVSAFDVSNTSGVAAGDIIIYEKATPANIYSMISAGGNQSMVPHKMVPLGKKLLMKQWMASEHTANKGGIARLRADCTNSNPPVRQQGVFLFKSTMGISASGIPMPLAYTIPALSIVKMSVEGTNANAAIVGHWWGVLKDE